MKISLVLLVFCGLTLSASPTKGQNQSVTLDVEKATILDIFRQIEEVSNLGFFFKNDQLNLQERYSVKVENASVEEVLNKVLSENGYDYQIVGENVVVTRKTSSIFETQQPQQITILGTVTDTYGQTIPGVNIVEKGTTNGVISDMEGNYSITVGSNSVLQFSFIGFDTKEVVVENRNNIDVVMEESSINLNEVVAVGYGTQKKVTVTGSVVSADGEDLAKVPTTSVTNTMIGRLPGMIANNRSGEPGYDDAELLIRGRSTT
ncbi:SusC/RagA family TonB-linked outer membrane protein, partial [Marinilabilia sp.]|uniref:STN domain-containing protein n=1 Tax=Marinilabilia sp. TaxID=2021252 RepID=UPI0025BEDBCD